MRGERGALRISLALALGILLVLPVIQSLAGSVMGGAVLGGGSGIAFADDPVTDGGQDPVGGMRSVPDGRLVVGMEDHTGAQPGLWLLVLALMTAPWR